jgi:hypothetical protein
MISSDDAAMIRAGCLSHSKSGTGPAWNSTVDLPYFPKRNVSDARPGDHASMLGGQTLGDANRPLFALLIDRTKTACSSPSSSRSNAMTTMGFRSFA